MAKRKEVILQEVLSTPQQWEDAMVKEKLYVVDVHQKWCGPCKAITGMLKRIKNELGDDYLCFAVAEADSIPSLESYRGKCEPIFLFFGCGQLVAYVRGCDAPLLQETIMNTLQQEHKILEGQAERKVIKDALEPEKPAEDETAEEDSEEEGEIVARKQVTVALIKPDVVSNGQVDEILEKINEAGIEVLVNEEKELTEDEAKSFYQNKADEEYFDELIAYVTSGPCRVLVLTKGGSGEGVVEQWREIIGPFDAAVAKEENPDSLRAIYGTDAKANALHGSSSQEEAARELGFFYPEFELPTYRAASAAPSGRSRASARSRKSARKQKQLQRTLAIIRPDALKKHKDAIIEKIAEAGFEISMMKEMELSEEQAKAFYKEHEGQPYFEKLVGQMTSGPLLALCLAHTDAVRKWRDMLGPKEVTEAAEQQPDSLRAQFQVEDAEVNMLHGSDSTETATEELKSIFKIEQSLAVIKPDAMEQKDAIIEKLKEAGFMISLQKDVNLTKEVAGEIYKSKEGAEFYDNLIDHMTSGPTLMMVLSSEDVVNRLRTMMGPADPEEAKQSAPDSLRAMFAKSILENAVHSPSTSESAKEKIKSIFGDVEFNWDEPEPEPKDEETAKGEAEEKADEPKPEGEDAPAEEEVKPEGDEEEKKEEAEPAAGGEESNEKPEGELELAIENEVDTEGQDKVTDDIEEGAPANNENDADKASVHSNLNDQSQAEVKTDNEDIPVQEDQQTENVSVENNEQAPTAVEAPTPEPEKPTEPTPPAEAGSRPGSSKSVTSEKQNSRPGSAATKPTQPEKDSNPPSRNSNRDDPKPDDIGTPVESSVEQGEKDQTKQDGE